MSRLIRDGRIGWGTRSIRLGLGAMATELLDRDGGIVRKGRVSPALKAAITLIVHEGLTVREAAGRTGYQYESLAKAMLKPHVRAFRDGVKRAWMESRVEKAWLTVANLADESLSDDVRLKAAKTFLDAAGELTPDGGDKAGTARQLIQIVTQSVNLGQHPPMERLPGVIEAPAYRVIPSDRQTPDESDGLE